MSITDVRLSGDPLISFQIQALVALLSRGSLAEIEAGVNAAHLGLDAMLQAIGEQTRDDARQRSALAAGMLTLAIHAASAYPTLAGGEEILPMLALLTGDSEQ